MHGCSQPEPGHVRIAYINYVTESYTALALCSCERDKRIFLGAGQRIAKGARARATKRAKAANFPSRALTPCSNAKSRAQRDLEP